MPTIRGSRPVAPRPLAASPGLDPRERSGDNAIVRSAYRASICAILVTTSVGLDQGSHATPNLPPLSWNPTAIAGLSGMVSKLPLVD